MCITISSLDERIARKCGNLFENAEGDEVERTIIGFFFKNQKRHFQFCSEDTQTQEHVRCVGASAHNYVPNTPRQT